MTNPSKFVTALCAGIVVLACAGTQSATAKPCSKHTGASKRTCVAQAQRDAQKWPKNPTVSEIRQRVGDANWHKARQVALCETGMNLNHYPNGRYRGPLGMYVTTQQYGMRATGYWNPTTWQEHVAIAVAAHPITGSWSGWGCS